MPLQDSEKTETLDQIEEHKIKQIGELLDKEKTVKKHQSLIDEICTVVSKIIFQLQGQKNSKSDIKNVEVRRDKLLD